MEAKTGSRHCRQSDGKERLRLRAAKAELRCRWTESPILLPAAAWSRFENQMVQSLAPSFFLMLVMPQEVQSQPCSYRLSAWPCGVSVSMLTRCPCCAGLMMHHCGQ